MRRFSCSCGARAFFENSSCLSCGNALGFELESFTMLSAANARDGARFEFEGRAFVRCHNAELGAGCNWVVPEGGLCAACGLNRTIPNLSIPDHVEQWRRVELAKRRLVYGLRVLGLRLESLAADPAHGVAFDFLAPVGDSPVMTGHAEGVITLNLSEADPVQREQTRTALNERYRTLLGHLRHEIGHRYFQLLLPDGSRGRSRFRELFGDERSDYAAALARHYETPPGDEWANDFISAYASAHPHEDFAETWAHYLHMVDALETAAENGLARGRGTSARARRFDSLAAAWQDLTVGWNELNRSLGHEDAYPFTLGVRVLDKLAFIHDLIRKHGSPARRARVPSRANELPDGLEPAASAEYSQSALEGARPQGVAHGGTPCENHTSL
jgi:hypothetical protein